MAIRNPTPRSPRKLLNFGRPSISLTEQHQATIRFHVHSLLAVRIYPTTSKILVRILAENADFPIQSTTSLWRWMKKLGFAYKRTSKVVVPLNTPTFMAARARYFAAIDELRASGAKIFWHDETWANKNEETRFVWTNRTTGVGRMRSSIRKRLAISALLGESGFYKQTIDMFKCDENHTMDSRHFLTWIDQAASLLREEF
ncbi:unnamed protein product, partial [Rotaria sp. Silwood1]